MDSWTILLIDDDEDEFILLTDMVEQIEERTIHLKWVSSLLHGQKELEEHSYDAVLVDYDLKCKQNGLDFIHDVRLLDQSLPLILYTGSNDKTLYHRAYIEGASFFLPKASADVRVLEQILNCLIEPEQGRDLLGDIYSMT